MRGPSGEARADHAGRERRQGSCLRSAERSKVMACCSRMRGPLSSACGHAYMVRRHYRHKSWNCCLHLHFFISNCA